MNTLLKYLICYIETAIVTVINLLVEAVAALIAALVVVLPDFPTLPTMPSELSDSLAFGEYWFPLDWFFTELVVFVTLAITWFAISIALRWVKAIRGNQ